MRARMGGGRTSSGARGRRRAGENDRRGIARRAARSSVARARTGVNPRDADIRAGFRSIDPLGARWGDRGRVAGARGRAGAGEGCGGDVGKRVVAVWVVAREGR